MAFEDEEDESQASASSETLEDTQLIHILLPEIVIEILSRLPVESLLRCKSVCKSWHSLISDPRFVKYHLSLSTGNSDHAHHRLIFCTGSSVEWCPLRNVIYDKSINTIELDYPLKHPLQIVRIAGSCNGLLCIIVEDDHVEVDTLFIWNPSTRRSKRLPYSGYKASPFPVCGFGYEESSNDYKVVLIGWGFENGDDFGNWVMIYSLNSGNWKRISEVPYGISVDDFGEFSNGALHWMATSDSSSSSLRTKISLDLATETYGEVLQPVYDEGDKHLHLGVWGDCLCLVSDYCENQKIDVWVMKVYGVKDSWTKLASIKNLIDPPFYPFWGSHSLPITNDGNFVLRWGPKLVLYDAKNGSSSEIKNYDKGVTARIIVESLVSLDAHREN